MDVRERRADNMRCEDWEEESTDCETDSKRQRNTKEGRDKKRDKKRDRDTSAKRMQERERRRLKRKNTTGDYFVFNITSIPREVFFASKDIR